MNRLSRPSSLLVLLPLPALAFDHSSLAMIDLEESFLDELPIVLSATRLAQPMVESPVATTIINRSMIEASGARTIPDILRLVPGFQVGYFDGNSPVATYHGHSGELATGLQVLIDGRSVYLPSRNAVPWSDLIVSIDDIDKIEVTRGPNAATYGSNSFLAVVNITTQHAAESRGSYGRLRAGSFHTTDALYQYGGRNGRMDYRVNIGTQNDDGTRYLTDYTASDFFSYRLDYQHSLDNTISYQGGYKKILLGDHEPSPNYDPYAGHETVNTSAFQQIKWEYQLTPNNNFTLQYYYNFNESRELASYGKFTAEDLGLPANTFDDFEFFADIAIRSERHDLEFTHFISPGYDMRLVWGVSGRLDIVHTNEGFFDRPGRQSLKMYRGFANLEWHISNDWILNSGFLAEDNDISGHDISPRLSLIYKLSPNQSLRLNHSSATRTPTLFEEEGKIVFSQDITIGGQSPSSIGAPIPDTIKLTRLLTPGKLQAEKISSMELGYYGQLLDDKLQLDIKLFRDKTSNLIDIILLDAPGFTDINELNTDGPLELIENANKTLIRGSEVSLNYQINPQLHLYAFFAHIKVANQFLKENAESRYDKTAPKNSGGLMLNKQWNNGLNTSLIYYNVGDMEWMDRTGSRSAQAYQKLDLRIARTFRISKSILEFSLIGQNLYEDFSDYNNTTFNADGSLNRLGSPQERKLFIDIKVSF